MRLSKHFTLAEFTRSDTAARLKVGNAPTPEHLAHLIRLAGALEEARAVLGDRPIRITSGYRNATVNRAAGGVPNSHHAQGWAADFHVDGLSDLQAAQALAASDLRFDQLIYEPGRCVHLSVAPRLRGERLTQRRAGAACERGINP